MGAGSRVSTVIVRSLDEAQAVLTLAAAVERRDIRLTSPPSVGLASPPSVGRTLGIGFMAGLIRAAGAPPEAWIIDCGPHAGDALAACRLGLGRIAVDLPADDPRRAALADIARQSGQSLVDPPVGAFDFSAASRSQADPLAACRAWLYTPACPVDAHPEEGPKR